MAELSDIEREVVGGALAALRRRAARQRKLAAGWTVSGEGGVRIIAGEGAVALRIAEALEDAANGLEGGGAS
jgi:hypothetical protein